VANVQALLDSASQPSASQPGNDYLAIIVNHSVWYSYRILMEAIMIDMNMNVGSNVS